MRTQEEIENKLQSCIARRNNEGFKSLAKVDQIMLTTREIVLDWVLGYLESSEIPEQQAYPRKGDCDCMDCCIAGEPTH